MQRDGQTGTQTDRQTGRQKDRERDKETGRVKDMAKQVGAFHDYANGSKNPLQERFWSVNRRNWFKMRNNGNNGNNGDLYYTQ